jgi:hypothetical protein
MIKLENYEVVGWEHAIRGMRNPMNSWKKSDSTASTQAVEEGWFDIGPNDHKLMMKLANGGPVHAKYRRMITVYVDITAPLYWWKEFDTYKVGTVANSCSTMHKIHEKEFTLEDFSCEHLFDDWNGDRNDGFVYHDTGILGEEINHMTFIEPYSPKQVLELVIEALNVNRESFLETKDKKFWWQMIQLLPSSYNQKRTVMLNYEVLVGIYKWRKDHKLDEWITLCSWIKSLPYSEIITGEVNEQTMERN